MLTLGLSLVPRVVSVTLGPACRRPSRPVVQLEELLLVCVERGCVTLLREWFKFRSATAG